VSLNYLRVSDFTLSPAASSTRTSELPKEMENIREQTLYNMEKYKSEIVSEKSIDLERTEKLDKFIEPTNDPITGPARVKIFLNVIYL
jgi:hypothetical protein